MHRIISVFFSLVLLSFCSCDKFVQVCEEWGTTVHIKNGCDEEVVVSFRNRRYDRTIHLAPSEQTAVECESGSDFYSLRFTFGDTVAIRYNDTCTIFHTYIEEDGHFQFFPSSNSIFDEVNWTYIEDDHVLGSDCVYTILPPGGALGD